MSLYHIYVGVYANWVFNVQLIIYRKILLFLLS